MKIEKAIGTVSVAAFAALSAHAQSIFQNLNFENANPVPIFPSEYYPYAATPSSALPGWAGSINGVPVTQVFRNDYALGTASIDIFRPWVEFP